MSRWLLIVLMPVALAGCVTEQPPGLPMALGPSDAAETRCLRYGFPADAPAFGDCKRPGAVSTSQE
jgi:hypothetical protein